MKITFTYTNKPFRYTPSEIKFIEKQIKNSKGESISSLSERLSIQLNRSFQGVYQKVQRMTRTNVECVPNGLKYNGVAKKVEIRNNHFRIYF